MHHIIRKQIIELTVGKSHDVFQLQHRVSKDYHERIKSLIENAFESLSSEDQVLKIDRLEIDLGAFEENKIENGQWTENLIKKIKEQIQQAAKAPGETENITYVHKPQSICRQWLYYMQHGFLPWNTVLIDSNWYDKVLEVFASDYIAVTELRFIILRNSNAVKRIVQQSTESFLIKLVEILTAENQKTFPKIIDEIELVFSKIFYPGKKTSAITRKELRSKAWEKILPIAAGAKKDLLPVKLAQEILSAYTKEIRNNRIFFLKKSIGIKHLSHVLERLLKEHSGVERRVDKMPEQNRSVKLQKSAVQKHEVDLETEKPKAVAEGIFIHNAGIVLLHPFLKMLFERLRLIAAGNFIHTKAQQKAVYLLHYLATGNIDAEEYELVVAKVLCNCSFLKPVESGIKLSKKEIAEADNLLNVVIEQWEKIKGTSPSGLREGFLKRNGKLFLKNEKMILQVETMAIDVLLDYLPWNLSIIKLPWVKDILKVEWR